MAGDGDDIVDIRRRQFLRQLGSAAAAHLMPGASEFALSGSEWSEEERQEYSELLTHLPAHLLKLVENYSGERPELTYEAMVLIKMFSVEMERFASKAVSYHAMVAAKRMEEKAKSLLRQSVLDIGAYPQIVEHHRRMGQLTGRRTPTQSSTQPSDARKSQVHLDNDDRTTNESIPEVQAFLIAEILGHSLERKLRWVEQFSATVELNLEDSLRFVYYVGALFMFSERHIWAQESLEFVVRIRAHIRLHEKTFHIVQRAQEQDVRELNFIRHVLNKLGDYYDPVCTEILRSRFDLLR